MEVAKYFGDYRLRHRVVYSRNSYSECIYCGERADTREHIPSKVFLSQPFPANLSTVPACSTCNNSYSNDELFLSLLIQILKQKHYGSAYSFSQEVNCRMEKNVKLVRDINNVIDTDNLINFHTRILRVLTKLAIGHSVYEVSEGYFTDDEGITADSAIVRYCFLNNMSQEEIQQFRGYFIITDEAVPELGSRAYERILVLESDYGEKQFLLDWVEVQESEYAYTCYKFGREDKIVVKMVINNFLFAEVILREDNST